MEKHLKEHSNPWPIAYREILIKCDNSNDTKFWLDEIEFDRIEQVQNGWLNVYFRAPTLYHSIFITNRFKTNIESEISSVLGKNCIVTFLAGEAEQNVTFENPLSAACSRILKTESVEKPPQSRPDKIQGEFKFTRSANDYIDANLTFSRFVLGSSSQLAYASSLNLCNSTPKSSYNPLYIYGPSGLGKTHLLHAIGNEAKSNNPNLRAFYVSAEKFVNEFIESTQTKATSEFRKKYRDNVDLLLIDDVQFFSGKKRSSEEFIHTFDALYRMNKKIVIASNTSPRYLEGFDEDIKSRLAMGMVADIKPLDIQTRIGILRSKAEQDDIYLPDDVSTFLAVNIKDDVRLLYGALIRLQQVSSLTGAEISLDFAKKVHAESGFNNEFEFSVEMILSAVCRHFNIKEKDLKGTSRAKNIIVPRQIAMYLLRKHSKLGFRTIGEIFNKDHSTVVHAFQKLEPRIYLEAELKSNLDLIFAQI